jgi:hypothetical protein
MERELEGGSSHIRCRDRLLYTADDERERDPYAFAVGPSHFAGDAVGGVSVSTSFSKPSTPEDKLLRTLAADGTEYHSYSFTTRSLSLDVHGLSSLDGGAAGSADGTPSSSASISNRHMLDDYLPSAVLDSCEGTGDPDNDYVFRMFGVGEDWTMKIVELSPLPVDSHHV